MLSEDALFENIYGKKLEDWNESVFLRDFFKDFCRGCLYLKKEIASAQSKAVTGRTL